MASWVFCNRCFQPPSRTARFSLTSCGHVYCDGCLSRGKKDECLICKVPCRTVLLSKDTDSGIQALFMGVDSLCRKYSKETSQVSEFQERHRRRLAAFHREKIARLEESLRESALRVEQLQSLRPSQHAAFSVTQNPVSTPSATPGAPLLLRTGSAVAGRCVCPRSRAVVRDSRRATLTARAGGRPGQDLPDQPPSGRAHGQRLLPRPSAAQPDARSPQRVTGSQGFASAEPLPGVVPESRRPGHRQSRRRGLVRSRQPPGPGPQAAHQHLGAAAETAVRVRWPRGARTREVTCCCRRPPAACSHQRQRGGTPRGGCGRTPRLSSAAE
ncbi:probable E3 SUMO-protein ligase RNF212 [Phyllostomus hastatus]|uniref:probable E3 SUMO-protein ligase RNF212 n=1 Tax=Phyllostomus hastatus TaxID=9423 RepID=UPI001E683E8D|nr:probable E3 SUMO-protein ligase RNF212 [Phyllostomus hastatus]